ncbi:DNA topoisomerase III [Pseudomonas caricapapayae]|nr:DNA topoisomerase III [Pseudomonas caricapapayae]
MRVVLCEKPSQASDIAKVIGATRRGKGFFEGNGLIVTYAIGHLMENATPEDYDEKYKKWSIEDLPIVPSRWKMKAKKTTAAQLKIVTDWIKKAESVVIATDPDREGELIAWEILEHCKYNGAAERMLLSALNQASIKRAWSSLRPAQETVLLYHSALARGRGDWLVGMNLSRLFTLLGRNAGYFGVLSIGRVQTPTLRIVVDRDKAIQTFVPTAYWDIILTLQASDVTFKAKWTAAEDYADGHGRCISENAANAALKAMTNAAHTTVVESKTDRVTESAPLPFSLSSLQQACSRVLGLGAQETLDIAQALYETHKATTYPRADTGYLDESMHDEAPLVFQALIATDPSIAGRVQGLDARVKSRAWNSTKVTAHHGIIPTIEPSRIDGMSEKEAGVYRLIRAHFLAQFMPPYDYLKTVITFECGGERAIANGRKILSEGWKVLLDSNDQDEDAEEETRNGRQTLPKLNPNDRAVVMTARSERLMTTPLKYLSEGDLIAAMKGAAKLVSDPRLKQKLKDTTGIGTEATRAGIIQGLIERGFMIKKGRTLRATEAGLSLIASAPEAVTNPGMTAIWEQALDMVESGAMTLDDFVSKQSMWVSQMVKKYASTTLTFNLEKGPECPICQNPTVKKSGDKGPFWACSKYPSCRGTVSVSSDGKKPRKRKKAA